MSKCLEQNQILALLAGGDPAGTSLRAHLGQCASCRRRVAHMLGAFRLAGHCEAFLSGAAADLPSDVVQRAFRQLEPLYRLEVAERIFLSANRPYQQQIVAARPD